VNRTLSNAIFSDIEIGPKLPKRHQTRCSSTDVQDQAVDELSSGQNCWNHTINFVKYWTKLTTNSSIEFHCFSSLGCSFCRHCSLCLQHWLKRTLRRPRFKFLLGRKRASTFLCWSWCFDWIRFGHCNKQIKLKDQKVGKNAAKKTKNAQKMFNQVIIMRISNCPFSRLGLH
jgi:hypothetical protein